MDFRFLWKSGRAADITAMTEIDPKPTSTIELLSGAEQFDEGGTKPTKGRIVVISLVPIDANVERRDGYR